jgi:hypothetical protein
MIYTKKWGDNVKQYLYKLGNEYESISGGWIGSTGILSTQVGNNAVMPTITKSIDRIKIYERTGGSANHGSLIMKNSIDLTNYKKICVETIGYDRTSTRISAALNFVITASNPYNANYTAFKSATTYFKTNSDDDRIILTIDISTVTGLFYLAFAVTAYHAGDYREADTTVFKVWLE